MDTTAEVEYTYAESRAGIVRPEGAIFPNEQGFAFDCGANGGMADSFARVAVNDYDEVNRLIEFARGNFNNLKSAIENPKSAEDWSLDMTGNWSGFVQKTSGSTDLEQGRTHNPVNEITAITAATGTDWADPEHDRNGNMTTIPKPANLADGLTATYDAWNRLVEVKDGQTVIARYEYDGLNRRITSHIDSGTPSNPTGIDTYLHYYYNSAWQILETRQSDTPSVQSETLQPKHQYVWSQRYIDACVLRDENTGNDGLCNDDRIYYLGDANFNITTLVDTDGDPLERYVYSPYGVLTIYDPSWSAHRGVSSHLIEHTFTGRLLDLESGFSQYRYRMYHPTLGTFVTRDPFEPEGNLLRYVRNNPVLLVDPTGMSNRYVICSFTNGAKIWSETVTAYTSETPAQACQRHATVFGLLTAWTVLHAREGSLYGDAKTHGGRWESDYADLRVTCNQCKANESGAEETCRREIGLRAASLQLEQNILGMGEAMFGGVLLAAGVVLVKTGLGAPAGLILVVAGVGFAGKGVYDIYVTGEIGHAAQAAAGRYCDCAAIVP